MKREVKLINREGETETLEHQTAKKYLRKFNYIPLLHFLLEGEFGNYVKLNEKKVIRNL